MTGAYTYVFGASSYFSFGDGSNGVSGSTAFSQDFNLVGGSYTISLWIYGNPAMLSDTVYHDLISVGATPDGSGFRAALWRSGIRPGELYSTTGGASAFGTGIGKVMRGGEGEGRRGGGEMGGGEREGGSEGG